MTIHVPRAARQYFVIALSSTLSEIGNDHPLNKIYFESMTTGSVEYFFKGMRADHDMPTVANYAYRRFRCVQDNMLRIYQRDFSCFTGPNSIQPEKIIKGEPPNITKRLNEPSFISDGSGCKEGDNSRESEMREFVTQRVWKRRTTGKCPLKDKRADWHTSVCPYYASQPHRKNTKTKQQLAKQRMPMLHCMAELCGFKPFNYHSEDRYCRTTRPKKGNFAVLAGSSFGGRTNRSI